MRNRKVLWWTATFVGLVLSYVAVGLLSLQLAIPPSYASPLYPAAGLALAALLRFGPGQAPAIALGSFAVNVLLSHERGAPALLAPALIGIGAMLQALVGAWAVKRWVGQPLLLLEPRDLARFFVLGAGLACVISPTVGSLVLYQSGAVDAARLASNWSYWWVGDTMGVLIAAPIALTLIGRPRKAWAPRRLSVGLPMLLTTLVMVLGTLAVTEWDRQRARNSFERDASNAAHRVETLLREPLMALEASRGLLVVSPQLDRAAFERAVAGYLRPDSPLLALGIAQRVDRARVPAFEAVARGDGLAGFTARDRQRPGDRQPPADEDMLAIRLVEPLARNAVALGINLRSVPQSQAALEQAIASGRAAATAALQLSQDAQPAIGIAVYQPVFQGQPRTPAERAMALESVAFAALRPDQLLASVAQAMPAELRLCLIDLETQSRLAGADGCERMAAVSVQKLRDVQFGGRAWQIRVYAAGGAAGPTVEDARSWPFALVGLLTTGLLGVLLLVISGRARRIEDLVRARTAELKREAGEREQAAAALSESERRFRSIFDKAPIGIVFADINGGMKEINPYFCRLVNYPASFLQTQRSLDITHPDDRAGDIKLGRALLRGEIDMYRRNKRYLTGDGRVITVRAVVSLQHDADGKPHRLVGVVEDIADQLKMEELERARQAAEAASRAKNEFLSRMSHELRTPLNAMLGFTQLLEMDLDERLSPRQRHRTAQIQQAGWHLLEMINETLDLSRIESGVLKLESERLSVARLLDDAIALIEADARAKRLTLTRELADAAGHVVGDATRLKQVLTNLLSNAVKYNVDGGAIAITSRRLEEGRIEIAVSDSGLGMDEAQLAELFQPFNRLGREYSGTAGTGIGLVISKRLVELMHGELRVESRAGQGSRFALLLPGSDMPATIESGLPLAAAVPTMGRRRILYIEDNATNAEVMRGILDQRPQIELEIQMTGLAGLAAIDAERPDLVLLDMQLPDIDGIEVLRRLRAQAAHADLPVVIVSANALSEQIQAGRSAGVRHYLTKPVDVRELLGLLDELLADRPTER